MKRILIILIFLFVLTACDSSNISDDKEYIVDDIYIETNGYRMPGKLTVPANKTNNPAVIFMHGSGAVDMNGSIGELKMYEDMSIQLAEMGIASIRFNKRTFEYAKELQLKYDFTIYDESIYDVIHSYEILKNDTRIDNKNIYLIGHSQGGTFAPLIANIKKDIKGIIIMAGTTEHILNILMNQVLKYQGEEVYNQYKPYADFAKTIKTVAIDEERHVYFGAYSGYWANYNTINFEEELITAANENKILVMQGGKDLQVFYENYERYTVLLKESNNCYFKYYENLNHCFVNGIGETLETAYQVEKQIPNIVIEDIVNFINGN